MDQERIAPGDEFAVLAGDAQVVNMDVPAGLPARDHTGFVQLVGSSVPAPANMIVREAIATRSLGAAFNQRPPYILPSPNSGPDVKLHCARKALEQVALSAQLQRGQGITGRKDAAMTCLRCQGREACLSYSANVHAAETVDELLDSLRRHVAPILRAAFGPGKAAANLRLGMQQADELLGHPVLPSTSTLSDSALKAPPGPACERLLQMLDELGLDAVLINAFPIRDFHAPRVKEQVYSPPWTDGGRALYSLKIAKVLAHILARQRSERVCAAISVPTGVFKAQYGDSEEVREQCAHFLTECVRELLRLETLTGKTVQLGLEPEPLTTAETCGDSRVLQAAPGARGGKVLPAVGDDARAGGAHRAALPDGESGPVPSSRRI